MCKLAYKLLDYSSSTPLPWHDVLFSINDLEYLRHGDQSRPLSYIIPRYKNYNHVR